MLTPVACAGCGDRTIGTGQLCARCLLASASLETDVPILAADESPPCEILSVIGGTARAIAFLSEQTWPVRRLVVLKLFRDEACCPFACSRSSATTPRHPGIAPVLERGRLHGKPYLITPYFSGGTVTCCCDRQQSGAKERVAALLALTESVIFAHARGIAHGRLVPGNLLCETRSPQSVRIVDVECNAAKAAGAEPAMDVLVREDLAAVHDMADRLLGVPLDGGQTAADVLREIRATGASLNGVAATLRTFVARPG